MMRALSVGAEGGSAARTQVRNNSPIDDFFTRSALYRCQSTKAPLQLMRTIKAALGPAGLLNLGKLLPPR